VSPRAGKGGSSRSRSPDAVSECAAAHAPPADEQDSGRDRSPHAVSGVRRKSRSRSKKGKKAEAGAAVAVVAPPEPIASGVKVQLLFLNLQVFLPVLCNVFLLLRACVCTPLACSAITRHHKRSAIGAADV
jgi:hypothetical protein